MGHQMQNAKLVFGLREPQIFTHFLIALETDDTKLVSSVYKAPESDATKKEIAEENSSR